MPETTATAPPAPAKTPSERHSAPPAPGSTQATGAAPAPQAPGAPLAADPLALVARSTGAPEPGRGYFLSVDAGLESAAEAKVQILNAPSQVVTLKKSDYRSVLKTLTEAVTRDGLLSNFLDMMKELGSGGFQVKCGELDEQYGPVFRQACWDVNRGNGTVLINKEPGMDAVQRKFTHAYWTSGLMVWMFRSEQRPILGTGGKGGGGGTKRGRPKSQKNAQYPVELELLDPLKVDIDKINSTGEVFMEFSADFVKAIQADPKNHPFMKMFPTGKRGPKDPPNLYKQQDVLDLVNKKKSTLPLPIMNIRVVRRVDDDATTWPIPYFVRCLDALNHKRMLVNMDWSLLQKTVNLILQIKVGSQLPGQPILDEHLITVRRGFETKMQADPSRMQVAVTPNTHEMQYVTVPHDAMLRQESYRVANFEVMAALMGLVANQLLADNGKVDLGLIVKVLYSKSNLVFNLFAKFIQDIYTQEIILGNNYKDLSPLDLKITPRKVTTLETDAFKTFVTAGTKMGALSVRTFIEEAGFDYEAVREELLAEQEDRTDFQIWQGMPAYVQTSITPGGTKQNASTPAPGKDQGQPQEDKAPQDQKNNG